jgi:uncharacterized membrane protein
MDDKESLQRLREEISSLQSLVESQEKRIGEMENFLQKARAANQAQRHAVNTQARATFSLENFIGLRLIHLVGIVVLVIGLSIGVKYAIDKDLISESLRIILAYAAGIILYILSVRLKNKYNLFSAILLSGAMASMYFTTYAAFVYYGLFPFVIAFIVMVAFTFFTVYQAIVYNRQEIAILGMVGAYAIPFLVSQNAERIDLFFFYIALINTGVAWLVLRKRWKITGRIAQGITWILFLAWASIRFDPAMQGMASGFIIYFYLLFSVLALGSRVFNKSPLSINDIYQLLANNVVVYIAALFVYGFKVETANLAMITLLNGALMAAEAVLLDRLWKETLAKKMLATLALFFFVMFIGFQWSGVIVTMLWLLTAVVIFAAGYRFRSVVMRMASIALMGLTLGKLLLLDSMTFSAEQKIVSYIVLGILLLIVSFFYQKFREKIFRE